MRNKSFATLLKQLSISQWLGALAAIAVLSIYVHEPSFPTPDKLIVFMTGLAMAAGQARAFLKRLGPFVALLLIYEQFRGLAHILNTHVNYLWMPAVDRWLFVSLPTATLQHWLWHGNVRWFDFLLYLVYMLHFVMPLSLAVVVWKTKPKHYWLFMNSFVVLSFMGFVTYLVFPAAPPWMASDMGLIEPITRISSKVWFALGVHDFPSVYDKIAPNPVAAVPSLHTGYSFMFALIIWRFYGRKWGTLAALYPALMMFGIVYQGEHYVIDLVFGIVYAIIAYAAASWAINYYRHRKTVAVAIPAKATPPRPSRQR